MAARVIPAHNPFMPWKPLANVSQKSFQHFLLISEITSVPVKGAILVLLLKTIWSPSTFKCHVTRAIPGSSFRKTNASFNFKTFTSLILILETSVLDIKHPPSMFYERLMVVGVRGAVWIPWEPWSLIGLGNPFKSARLLRLSSRLELLQGSSDMMCIRSTSESSIRVILPLWNRP